MKDYLFAELMESATEALEHARGKRELRTIILPDPPEPMKPLEVKRLRKRLSASQAVFAHCLNVSTKLVQAWEAHRREPDGAALRLLRLAEDFPALIFAGVTDRPSQTRSLKRSRLRKAANHAGKSGGGNDLRGTAKLRERRRAKIYAAYEEASRDPAFMHDMNADLDAFDATLADGLSPAR